MGRLQKLFRRARRTYLGREDSKIIGARCGETGESLSISADCECSVFTQPTHRSGAVAADDRRKDRRQWARPNGRVRKKALHSHPAPPRQPHPSVLACCAAIRLFAPLPFASRRFCSTAPCYTLALHPPLPAPGLPLVPSDLRSPNWTVLSFPPIAAPQH